MRHLITVIENLLEVQLNLVPEKVHFIFSTEDDLSVWCRCNGKVQKKTNRILGYLLLHC